MEDKEVFWKFVSKVLARFPSAKSLPPAEWSNDQIDAFLLSMNEYFSRILANDKLRQSTVGIKLLNYLDGKNSIPFSAETFRKIFRHKSSKGTIRTRDLFAICLGFGSYSEFNEELSRMLEALPNSTVQDLFEAEFSLGHGVHLGRLILDGEVGDTGKGNFGGASSITRTFFLDPRKPNVLTGLVINAELISRGFGESSYPHCLRQQLKLLAHSTELVAILYNREEQTHRKYKLGIDFSSKLVTLCDENGKHFRGGLIDSENLIELRSEDNTARRLYFEKLPTTETLSSEFVKAKRIIPATLYIIEGQMHEHKGLVFSPDLLEEVDGRLSSIAPYFQNDEIRKAFSKSSTKTLDSLSELVTEFQACRKETLIEIPSELAIAYQQFLSYFSEYVKYAKGIEIEFNSSKKGEALSITVKTLGDISMEQIGNYLQEYFGFTKQNLDNLKIPVETNLSDNDFNLLALGIKHEVTSLRHRLELSQVRNEMLSGKVSYLEQIVAAFAKKDNVINIQNISGGDQQFADKIKNQKP